MAEDSARSDSGTLALLNRRICYTSDGYGTWELPVDQVRVIGQYTDENGPHAADWFLVFVTSDGSWYGASNYADAQDRPKRTAFEQALQKHFKSIVLDAGDRTLVTSTTFNSLIMWPPELQDKKLFDFQPLRGKNAWERLVRLISRQVSQKLSGDVEAWLAAHR
jgi:hypothetical protein